MPVPSKFDTKDIVALDTAVPQKFDASQIEPIDSPPTAPVGPKTKSLYAHARDKFMDLTAPKNPERPWNNDPETVHGDIRDTYEFGRELTKGAVRGGAELIRHPINAFLSTGTLLDEAALQAVPATRGSYTDNLKSSAREDLKKQGHALAEQIRTNPAYLTGTIAGQMVVGEAAGDAAGKGLKKGLEIFPKIVRSGTEVLTKTTPRDTGKFVEETGKSNADNISKADAKNASNKERADDINAQRSEIHARRLQTVEAANAAKQAEFEAAKTQAEEINRAAAADETTRGQLARQVKAQAARLVERVRAVKDATKEKIDTAYGKIREATGEKVDPDTGQVTRPAVTIPRENLASAVGKAEKLIKGSDENLKMFRDILSKAEEGKAGESMEDTSAPPADFTQLQGYYSEIGDKLSGGNLPPDVYRAMRSLQEDVGGMMQKMAKERGVGAQLRSTQQLFRDYMQTFRESAGPNHSGSPIAQALDASDPAYAIKPLTAAETAARVRNMLSKFDPSVNGQGGAGKLFDNFRDTVREFDGTGQVKPAAPPTAPVLKPTPEPPKVIQPKLIQPEITKLGPEELRAQRAGRYGDIAENLRERAVSRGLKTSLYSLPTSIATLFLGHPIGALGETASGIGVFVTSQMAARILERPAVVEWLSRPSPADIAQLEKLPASQRLAAAETMKPIVEQAKSKGITVAPSIAKFVGATARPVGPRTKKLKEIQSQYSTQ